MNRRVELRSKLLFNLFPRMKFTIFLPFPQWVVSPYLMRFQYYPGCDQKYYMSQ